MFWTLPATFDERMRRWRPLLLTGLAGITFALATWSIFSLEFRFGAAVSLALIVISIGMMSIYWLEDFLLYALFLNIPFSGFGKWLFVQPVVAVAKGINFGLAEIVLIVAYTHWFFQIFAARSRPLPKLGVFDTLFGVLFVAQCLSFLGAPDRALAFFDIVYNVKFYLIFFYIAHKIERRHLKVIVVLLMLGLLVEGPLALYERLTGNVGIGRTKGDVAAAEFGNQYEVPGLEQIRAEGTTKDSHTLGEYLAMLLPLPLAYVVMRQLKPRIRLPLAGALLIGIGGLVVTFSRAGWFSFALASAFLLWLAVFVWRQGQALFITLSLGFAVSLLYPKIFEYAIVRIFEAPGEIMQSRYDMNWTALNIMREHFLFGYGPGNYLEALSDPNINVIGPDWLPVHNAFLYIASESGIFAALAFFAMIWVAMLRCWRQRRHPDLLIRGLATAMCAGFLAYLLDGLTNPTFKEVVPYMLFWIYLGLSAALPRLTAEPPAGQAEDSVPAVASVADGQDRAAGDSVATTDRGLRS